MHRCRTRDRRPGAATPSGRTPRSASWRACPLRAAHRTRGGGCARPTRAGTDRWPENRSRRVALALALETAQELADLRRLEALARLTRVVEEPASGLGPELAALHLLLHQPGCPVALIARRPPHERARPVEDVDATPVDELEDADAGIAEAHPRADRAIDLLGHGHPFFDEAHCLVHEEHLETRHDEARRVGAAHRRLAQTREERDGTIDDGRRGGRTGHDLDERNDV